MKKFNMVLLVFLCLFAFSSCKQEIPAPSQNTPSQNTPSQNTPSQNTPEPTFKQKLMNEVYSLVESIYIMPRESWSYEINEAGGYVQCTYVDTKSRALLVANIYYNHSYDDVVSEINSVLKMTDYYTSDSNSWTERTVTHSGGVYRIDWKEYLDGDPVICKLIRPDNSYKIIDLYMDILGMY